MASKKIFKKFGKCSTSAPKNHLRCQIVGGVVQKNTTKLYPKQAKMWEI